VLSGQLSKQNLTAPCSGSEEVSKAHRLLYHSILGLRLKKEKKEQQAGSESKVERSYPAGVQGYLPHKKTPPGWTLQ
jgi:hypothetical protein